MKITVEAVRELALTNYNKGGDSVYECYEDFQIRDEINKGATTPEAWLNIFDFYKGIENEFPHSGYMEEAE